MSPLISTLSPATAPALLRQVGRRDAGRRTLLLLAPVLGAAVLLAVVAMVWPVARLAVLLISLLLIIGLTWYLLRLWRPRPALLARRLDRHYPVLEDSTGLLLRDPAELNLLEQLQQQRTESQVAELLTTDRPLLPVAGRAPLLLTGLLLLLAAGAWLLRPRPQPAPTMAAAPVVVLHFTDNQPAAKPRAPRITATRLLITPPAYTRRAAFAAAQPSFQCPAGSRVRWRVRVSRRAEAAPILELGKQRVPLHPVAGDSLAFETEQVVAASTLYRLRLAGRVSDDYAIEVLPDQAPTVQLLSPKPYTRIEFGDPPQVTVRVRLCDDYGLTRARLVATVAQGEGESVKFRQVVTELSGALSGQPTQATATHVLQLRPLGLTYGDELYFYVQAWDNHRQSARTDTYLVQWADTAVDDSGMAMSLGVSTVPAYFRSQRQVIIDTEKLLAERKGLDPAAFTTRANDIGHDQQVLRMRYGKFMGEEFEEHIGATAGAHDDHDEPGAGEGHHDHGGGPPAGSNPASLATTEALMDPYVHKHDDSETADFLEPAVKAKLSVVLNQMWEAELRLRTARPAAALPYEYKALRLLKEVQQQTRVYVKKAGYTPPPMPEATTRLTGELAGAAAPRHHENVPAPTAQPDLRAALHLVQALQRGQPARPTDAALLDRAGPALAQAALQRPGAYLSALRALRRLSTSLRTAQPPCPDCLPAVARALTALLPAPVPVPTPAPAPDRLARRYLEMID